MVKLLELPAVELEDRVRAELLENPALEEGKDCLLYTSGIPYMKVYELSAQVMVEGLKELGLMKGNADDAVREGAHALFYPHVLGHMMGLDVHDMENLGELWVGYDGQPQSTQFGRKSQRLAIPLEPGFVHTVEPGIYFIQMCIRDRYCIGRIY